MSVTTRGNKAQLTAVEPPISFGINPNTCDGGTPVIFVLFVKAGLAVAKKRGTDIEQTQKPYANLVENPT